MLDKAISITAQAFEGVYDKDGQPFILHCLRVMNAMPVDDPELRCIAVMHDLVEDTKWTETDLEKAGFSERVIEGVSFMTRTEFETYKSYITALCKNKDAVRVKMADLEDNSLITRLKGVGKKDFKRMKKYHKAYLKLKELV